MIRLLLLVSACLLASCAVQAQETGTFERSRSVAMQHFGDDLFVVGGAATVARPVAGDLIIAGGSLDVDESVAGDVLALGGRLRLGADVGQSVLAAAGQLTVTRSVGRNLRIAGGQVELGPASRVAGNVILAGGRLILAGAVDGHLQIAGASVLIDGPIGGDVSIAARSVELGPNARIAGALRYRSAVALVQDPQSQVAGGIERLAVPAVEPSAPVAAEPQSPYADLAASAAWALGLWMVAALLLALLPGVSGSVSGALRERPGTSLLLGFAFVVCTPVAAVILLITLIGIPLGLLALALYAVLLPLGYITGAIALADWVLVRWLPRTEGRLAPRLGFSALVLLLIIALGPLPVLGTLAPPLVVLAGIGAMLLRSAAVRRGARAVS